MIPKCSVGGVNERRGRHKPDERMSWLPLHAVTVGQSERMRSRVAFSVGVLLAAVAIAGDAVAQNKFAAEVVPQIGHSEEVDAVAFSPDGRFALSGSFDNTLRLWDLGTGKELRSFTGHTYYVTAVAFSPNSLLALSGSEDGALKLWDLSTGKQLRCFSEQEGSVHAAAFSRDGRFALSGGAQALKLWGVATGKELRNWAIGDVDSVAFSGDGRFALSGGFETLTLWELATGKELRSFAVPGDRIFSVAASSCRTCRVDGSQLS
jgi:WD40 repeat protein